jgi:hypothetical protein
MSIIDGTNFPSRVDLIFFLDAVNPKSYPGSGSTWYDATGNNNHFTLFNSPTYTSNGTTGTYLSFNGTNQYARSANAINFNAYSAVTIEIGYRTTVTNATQILYETTGTGGSTATGGITLLMNANNTGTAANTYLSQWQVFGSRLFGFTPNTNTSFNSVTDTYVNGSDSTGRQSIVNGVVVPYFTNTSVLSTGTVTAGGTSFANTWTYVASRGGTGNFFKGDIAYIRAWGQKINASDIGTTLSFLEILRQPGQYTGASIITNDPSNQTPYPGAGSQLVTSTGSYSYTVLGGVTSLTVEAWGGGGGSMGQDNTTGAGAGGAYARSIISVIGGQTIYVFVGAGGIGSQTGGTNGTNSWVNGIANSAPTSSTNGVVAVGGQGAPFASPNNSTQLANCIGTTIYIGGAGGTGAEGGGGGAAGPLGNGVAGSPGSGGAGGAGNNGSGGAGGSAGGTTLNGGDGISNVEGGGGGGGAYNNKGGMGGVPGGAGGAGYSTSSSPPASGVNTNSHGYGGDGGRGQVRISW